MSQPLQGKVAVVTGGSGGIGSATCKKLAQAGAHIALTYRSSRDDAGAVLNDLPGDNHMLA